VCLDLGRPMFCVPSEVFAVAIEPGDGAASAAEKSAVRPPPRRPARSSSAHSLAFTLPG
jgi:hypothetical protein